MHFNLLIISAPDEATAAYKTVQERYGASSDTFKFDGIVYHPGLLCKDGEYAYQIPKAELDIDAEHPISHGRMVARIVKRSDGTFVTSSPEPKYGSNVSALVTLDATWHDKTTDGTWDDFVEGILREAPDNCVLTYYNCHR